MEWRGFEFVARVASRFRRRVSRRRSPSAAGLELREPRELRTFSRETKVKAFKEGVASLEAYGSANSERQSLASFADRVGAMFWYHTIELPDGVVTKGTFDHRPLMPHYGLPDDLSGQSVLDVGTWDGYWAFELERRGAASVKALDLDWFSRADYPPEYRGHLDEIGFDYKLGEGFEVARRALGSSVQRIEGNVYDLDPEQIGTFDFVHVGDVLLHLEQPSRALNRIRGITSGLAMIIMAFDPDLDTAQGHVVRYLGGYDETTWWIPSLDASAQLILDAGFSDVRLHNTYRLHPTGGGVGDWRAVFFASP